MSAHGMRISKARKKEIGIWDLICWAFQREKAQLEFDEIEQETGACSSVGMEYVLMEQARLGCRVQGGGRSVPHHDADIVASALAVLPDSLGGRRSAIWVVELSRAGRTPEWDVVQRFEPVDWTLNQHGRRARVSDASELGEQGWPAQPRLNRKGRLVHDRVDYCPVEIRPSAAQVAAMRRAYLDWYRILFEVRTCLQNSHLTSFELTQAMPPRTPWQKKA